MCMSRDRIIQLQECAENLGFSTITEALDAGYHEVQDLVAGTFTLEKIDEQEKAHEAWLEEKNSLLKDLTGLQEILETLADGEKHEISSYWADTIWHAIEFIRKGEM